MAFKIRRADERNAADIYQSHTLQTTSVLLNTSHDINMQIGQFKWDKKNKNKGKMYNAAAESNFQKTI